MPTCNQRVAAGTAFRAKIGLSIPTLNSSLVYLVIRLDLPTPESPISYETEEVHAAGYTHAQGWLACCPSEELTLIP